MSEPEADPIYIEARNSLLKEAELAANRYTASKGLNSSHTTYNAKWSTHFHRTMDKLWKQRGAKLTREARNRWIA
jgi:hypothetical protein